MVRDDLTKPSIARRPSPRRALPTISPFWRRHFALAAALLVTALAVIVAFVATLVYAQVDAGRALPTEPSTVPRPPTTPASAGAGSSPVSRAPEILSEGDLAKKVSASVRAVHTQDESGQGIDGTAFVVGSFGGQTLLLTSFAVVRAGTKAPAPAITVEGSRQATLWTWQEDKDLALLVVPGSIETLPWAADRGKQGDKVYAVGAGQKPAVGVVTASTDTGVEHNIFTEGSRQGAPIVNQKGEVVAMASVAYDPEGKGTDTVFIGVPIRAACEKVLRCGGGNTTPSATTATTPASTTTTTTP